MTIEMAVRQQTDKDYSTIEVITSLVGINGTINIEGNIITEISGYSHIIVDRYYKGLTNI